VGKKKKKSERGRHQQTASKLSRNHGSDQKVSKNAGKRMVGIENVNEEIHQKIP